MVLILALSSAGLHYLRRLSLQVGVNVSRRYGEGTNFVGDKAYPTIFFLFVLFFSAWLQFYIAVSQLKCSVIVVIRYS